MTPHLLSTLKKNWHLKKGAVGFMKKLYRNGRFLKWKFTRIHSFARTIFKLLESLWSFIQPYWNLQGKVSNPSLGKKARQNKWAEIYRYWSAVMCTYSMEKVHNIQFLEHFDNSGNKVKIHNTHGKIYQIAHSFLGKD